MAGYQVITSALRKEAPKWDDFATALKPILYEVEAATLEITAFFVGDPAELAIPIDAKLHKDAYESYRSFVDTVLGEAQTEFGQIADALIKIGQQYDQAEDITELNLNEIYSV